MFSPVGDGLAGRQNGFQRSQLWRHRRRNESGQPGHRPGDSGGLRAGGGTVFVPAGTYLCGSIHLTNNIHLYLDAGAVILGAPQAMNAYDPTEAWHGQAYQDGGHTYFHNSLIWGENLTNVSITGPA